ncbi:hypothetical protein RI367_002962 [Sorochytrium milnesiophthora]
MSLYHDDEPSQLSALPSADNLDLPGALLELSWRKTNIQLFPPPLSVWPAWLRCPCATARERHGSSKHHHRHHDVCYCELTMHNMRILDLRRNRLRTLQPSIKSFASLQHLYLDHNAQLVQLPDEIGQLAQLETLSLVGCALESLPDALSTLAHLSVINASYNRLQSFVSLPPPALRVCKLRENRITTLEREFAMCAGALQVLDMSHNPLIEIACDLSAFAALRVLKLARCQLADIPPGIGYLESLETLVLHACTAQTAPATLPFDLAKLARLRTLDLSIRGITQIPHSIVQCHLLVTLTLPIVVQAAVVPPPASSIRLKMSEISKPIAHLRIAGFFNLTSPDSVTDMLDMLTDGQHLPQLRSLTVSCDTRAADGMTQLLALPMRSESQVEHPSRGTKGRSGGDDRDSSGLDSPLRTRTSTRESELVHLHSSTRPSRRGSRGLNSSFENLFQAVIPQRQATPKRHNRKLSLTRTTSSALQTTRHFHGNDAATTTATHIASASVPSPVALTQHRSLEPARTRNSSFSSRTVESTPSSSLGSLVSQLRRAVTLRGKSSPSKFK